MEPILLVDSNRGIYAPQQLAQYIDTREDEISKKLFNEIKPLDLAILKSGPDNPEYWDTFDYVTSNVNIDINSCIYYIATQEDVWLSPIEYEWN